MSERITVSEFARRAGCDEKQVRRAIDKTLLHKDSDGFLDAAQVDQPWRRVNRRTIAKIGSDNSPTVRKSSDSSDASDTDEVVREDETPAQAAERIVFAGGAMLSIDEAVKRKENYLGLLKQLEYDLKSGAVVMAAEVVGLVGAEFARVRTRLLAIPAERSPQLHRLKTVLEVQAMLEDIVNEALEELTQDGVRAPG